MSDNKDNKSLNNRIGELSLNDENSNDASEEIVQTNTIGRLERLIADENTQLLERSKTKKNIEPKIPIQRPIKPKPEIIHLSQPIISIDGQCYKIETTNNNSFTQSNRNMSNNVISNIIQIPAQQFQQSQQIESIKKFLQTPIIPTQSYSNDPYQNNNDTQNSPYQYVPNLQSTLSPNTIINDANLYNNLPSPELQIQSTPEFLGFENFNDYSVPPDILPQQQPLITNNNNVPDEHDICYAEVSLLVSLESVLRLKKERGET